MSAVLRWAAREKKAGRILIDQADEEGTFKITAAEPGLYFLLAIGRAGFNEAVWEKSIVEVLPEAETSLKLAAPEKACLVMK